MLDFAMRRAKKYVAWEFEDEKEFLDGLTQESLRGYIEGAYKRKVWDDLDRSECIGYARELLAGKR